MSDYSKQYELEEKLSQEEEKNYQQLLLSLKAVLDFEAGRILLWNILSECGIHDGGFKPSEQLQFFSGRRDVALQIIGWMTDLDPSAYANLQLHMGKR